MKLFFRTALFASSLLVLSCAIVSKKEPQRASPNVKSELAKIEIEIAAGAPKKAIVRLNKLIAQHPGTDVSVDAEVSLGQIYYQQANYNESYKHYLSVVNSEYNSARELEAVIGASRSLYKLGRYDEALNLSQKALHYTGLAAATKIEVHSLRYNIQWQMGDRLDALKSLVLLAESAEEPAQREKFRIRAADFVESSLKESELSTVAQSSEYGFVRAPVLYRVGLASFEQHEYARAENYFREIQTVAPGSDLAITSKNYLDQITARQRVAPFTVGAVLPLSGKYSGLGQKTLRGLELGLGIVGGNNSDFKLAVIDSEGNPDVARRAVERLVIEDSVVAIVGDLISKTAEPVAQKANELGVPVIGLSQKSRLTALGDNVFRNALTSQAIVSELVQTAIEKYGMTKFAILYPNDPYGIEYANLFWDEVLAHGAQITAAQIYSSEEKDFSGPISRLVGTYYLEDRVDEYTNRLKDWYGQQKVITSRVTPPNDLLPPIVDFDAVFIPDGVKALGQIASMLKFHDVDKIHLLGTNLWNNPAIVERGTSLIEDSLFVDAKTIVDNSIQKTRFYQDFKNIYNEEPSVFEAQAYDTALILKDLVSRGARSRVAVRDSLSKLRQFQGIVGDINVTDEREFTRALTVLTVKSGKIQAATGPESQKIQ